MELKFEERRLMIGRGLPCQEEPKRPLTRNDYLRRGVVAIGIGTGALVAYVLLGTSPNVGGLRGGARLVRRLGAADSPVRDSLPRLSAVHEGLAARDRHRKWVKVDA